MGSRISKDNENDCINQINNINENDLDLSNIDRLQIKVLKEMIKEIKEVKEKKSDKIMYRFPVQMTCKLRALCCVRCSSLMEVLRVVGILREGLTSNFWGLGCPIHCSPSSLPSILLALVLGWIAGVACCLCLAFRLGLLGLQAPSSDPLPSAAARRLSGYLHAGSRR